ncbi:hypothetical protein [Paenibacillus sp. HW567]|uniref:hypothetical protein n=1 Tax=Paenibacillus sp. HW567 TaxID=1034769 RepID=UPI0003685211|nr:hypothetical protein [Paenibacillus sp. HW567]
MKITGAFIRALILLSLLIILVLAGCEGAKKSSPISTTATPAVAMPEQKPADFAFSVRYGVTAKNEINTFNGTVTKDLVSSGTATANLKLTDAEMTDIYNRMRELNVLGELKLEVEDKACAQVPYVEEHWLIQINGEQRPLDWSEEHCQIPSDARKLKELRNVIVELVTSRSEYQALPEAVGGYE